MEHSWPIWFMLLLPLLGAGLMLLLPDGRIVRTSALVNTLVTLLFSLVLAFSFDWAEPHGVMQAGGVVPWVSTFGLNFSVGVDSISLWLVLLTTFLMPLVVAGSFSAVQERERAFYGWLLILQTAMIGTFVARDLIFFYICFEFTLIPLYFLIGMFGSTKRLEAARVFFLYTFTGSMLTFTGLLYVAWFNSSIDAAAYAAQLGHAVPDLLGTWTFDIQTLTFAAQAMSSQQQMMVMLALLAGFAVKVPLFPFHTWLPLAHTEAPTAGSVILAGVLLKLGTYGLLRFALPMTPEAVVVAAPWIGLMATLGILYGGLICWVQTDIKKLVAYSSVSHLGFCILGMFAFNQIGVGGSVLYMINHGLSTGALFFCIGMIYERFHTREMKQMSGLGRAMPVWATFFVFFCLASVGLPGLNGFVSEFLTLLGAFTAPSVLGPVYVLFAGIGMIIGAIYILYMVGKVVWGPVKIPGHGSDGHGHDGHDHGDSPSHETPKVADLSRREVGVLLPLAVACVILGLFPSPVLRSLEPAIRSVTQPANNVLAESRPRVTIHTIGVTDVQELMLRDQSRGSRLPLE